MKWGICMRRKLFNVTGILSLVITAVMALGIVSASAAETRYITNVQNSVYLRISPASDSYYCTIPLGASVQSVGWARGYDGEGYNQVIYNGYKGWVKTCFTVSAANRYSAPKGETMRVRFVDESAYLRVLPASGEYYTLVPKYAYVTSIGWARGYDGEGYNQVIYNGIRGWIKTSLLSYY